MIPASRRSVAWLVACALWPAACTFAPAPDPYQPCGPAGDCPAGCECLARSICVSTGGGLPWECSGAQPACRQDADCRLGCSCQAGACRLGPDLEDLAGADYCPAGPEPTCAEVHWTVDTVEDEEDGGPQNTDPDLARQGSGLSLREALILAAGRTGSRRIGFVLPAGQRLLELARDLPPLPSLTYLDGGPQGVELVGIGAQVGLDVAGRAVVVGHLAVSGFPAAGIRVEPQAADVHLFAVRAGEPGRPNGVGIELLPGSQRVVIGRGRELGCLEPRLVAAGNGAPRLEDYDLNLVIANSADGIAASRMTGLAIYGTWVGHSPWPRFDDARAGNGGVGIRLEQVGDVRLGAQGLAAEFAALDAGQAVDIGPAFVAVGRNAGGGVWIHGGGPVDMPGLILGDTPALSIYGQNQGFGLRIEGNVQPVAFGPALDAAGHEARLWGLIFTADAAPVEILEPLAPVILARSQIVSIDPWPQVGIRIRGNRAQVRLWHLSFTSNVSEAAVWLEDLQAGVQVVNCLFRGYGSAVNPHPVFAGDGLGSGLGEIRNNMGYNFSAWTADNQLGDQNLGPQQDPLDPLWADNARLTGPDGPAVDAAADLGLDLNAERTGDYNGCGPDIGAFECESDACLTVSCP